MSKLPIDMLELVFNKTHLPHWYLCTISDIFKQIHIKPRHQIWYDMALYLTYDDEALYDVHIRYANEDRIIKHFIANNNFKILSRLNLKYLYYLTSIVDNVQVFEFLVNNNIPILHNYITFNAINIINKFEHILTGYPELLVLYPHKYTLSTINLSDVNMMFHHKRYDLLIQYKDKKIIHISTQEEPFYKCMTYLLARADIESIKWMLTNVPGEYDKLPKSTMYNVPSVELLELCLTYNLQIDITNEVITPENIEWFLEHEYPIRYGYLISDISLWDWIYNKCKTLPIQEELIGCLPNYIDHDQVSMLIKFMQKHDRYDLNMQAHIFERISSISRWRYLHKFTITEDILINVLKRLNIHYMAKQFHLLEDVLGHSNYDSLSRYSLKL